jgi:hypothetical protein
MVGGALVASLCLISDGASGCHDQDGDARTVVCFTSIHAAVATSVFAPADIYYASEDRWLPPAWAWTQLLLGGLVTIGGSFVAIGLAVDDSPDPGLDIAWALGTMTIGGIYGSVGEFSLQRYAPPPAGDERAPHAGTPTVPLIGISPAPVGDGVMLMAIF